MVPKNNKLPNFPSLYCLSGKMDLGILIVTIFEWLSFYVIDQFICNVGIWKHLLTYFPSKVWIKCSLRARLYHYFHLTVSLWLLVVQRLHLVAYSFEVIRARSFPKRPLLSCALFTCDIYAKCFLLLLNNQWCK